MKSKETVDLMGCAKPFFVKWSFHQLYGNMTLEKYGIVWEFYHTIPISKTNLSNELAGRKCYPWINLRPLYSKEKNLKKQRL